MSSLTLYGAIESPSVESVQVLNDDITINWSQPNDPLGEFNQYNVYFSSQKNTGYSIVATITNYNNLSFTYNYPSLTSSNAYFFVTTGTTSGETFAKDTVQPIFLEINSTSDNVVGLSWNRSNLEVSNYFYVNKRIVGSGWVLVDSTSLNFYNDSAKVCADSIYYQISQKSIKGFNTSSVAGDFFEDTYAPSPPKIDSVSIEPVSGLVHVGWTENSEGDVGGYILLKKDPNWTVVDTIWGKSTTYYQEFSGGIFDEAIEYALYAFDTCGLPNNPNTSPSDTVHKTMFLTGESDACSRTITLNWNAYEGWDDGVGSYELYVSKDGGEEFYLEEIAASESIYTHDSLEANAIYCYRIVARNSGNSFSSSSNRICITMLVPKLPEYHYLSKVTVNDNNEVELKCYVDNKAAITHYTINRSERVSSGFEEIDQINTPTDSILEFTDKDVNPSAGIYYYKIVAFDECGFAVNESNISSNIRVVVQNYDAELKNVLFWNPYIDWDTLGSGVAYYNIYNGYDAYNLSSNPIAVVGAENISYEDFMGDDDPVKGQVCYVVEAVESEGNLFNFKETSRSNVFCVDVDPLYYIASAFTPNGDLKNEIFKPSFLFVSDLDYEFAVYSRFGGLIFKTTNPEEGWDGGDNPVGVYNYILSYTAANKKIVKKTGAVTLIR